jgi:thiol-disulfide isomerase/thioredoxin
MAGLYELVKRIVAPYYSTYVILFIIIIFLIAANYAYNEYKSKDSSVLDKIHQPSENVDEQPPQETPKPMAFSVPQIVGICLLIVLAIILGVWAYRSMSTIGGISIGSIGGIGSIGKPGLGGSSASSSGPAIFFAIVVVGAGILYGLRTLFYEKPTPELWEKKYRNSALGPKIESGKTITVYFFTADWCPHCRNAKPAIDEFEREYNNKVISNKTIIISRVDCTDSEVAEVAKQISDFGVTSFPTVKIKDSDSNTFEFDAKITKENLVNFVESVANN